MAIGLVQGPGGRYMSEGRSDGATFAGWYEKKSDGTLKDEAFDLSTPVEGELRLFAKWIPAEPDPGQSEATKYTVRFFDENGTLIQASKVVKDETASAPAVSARTGYKFDGWYTKTSDRYASTDAKVASVDANGKIRAKSKGSCYVYAYAANGVWDKMKVAVK